ncbi:MAG: thioredoxin family protein, partial [Synechococcaceae cyanobacterium RL_1_2]|nr:thioredoxin family protein [Synechococcaceae cyanobacterium RL_1_2]
MALLTRSLRLLSIFTIICSLTLALALPATASIDDDRYDGNI